jgi:hypothetical protein
MESSGVGNLHIQGSLPCHTIGVAPTVPRDRWDLLLPQAELTLNLLRPSNNPSQSAWESLFGPYNFDATPMGPAGCWVLIHTKATVWHSWDNRCHSGFYVGPVLMHYRCCQVLNVQSGAVSISDAIKFWHHYLPAPKLSMDDKLLHAVQAIHNTIACNKTLTNDEQLAVIETLWGILHTYRLSKDPASPPGVWTERPEQPPNNTSPIVHQPPGVHNKARWNVVPLRRGMRRPVTASLQPEEPVALRTRLHAQNAFALLAEEEDTDNETTPCLKPQCCCWWG